MITPILKFATVIAITLLTACTPRPVAKTPERAAPPKADSSATRTTLNITLSPTPTISTNVTFASTIEGPSPSRQMLLDSGRVFFQACAICHGKNGRGGRGPAVANSDYVQGDRTRLIHTVLNGVKEPITVNGVRWKTGEMLGWRETWDDFKIAAVLTYITVALNDSTVTDCIPEDYEAGTWASCTVTPRSKADIARDSVAVSEVATARTKP